MIQGWHENILVRRAGFIGATITAVTAVLSLVILPIHNMFAERDTHIAEQRAFLGRLTAIAAQETAVEALVRQADTDMDHGEFLPGTNEGMISADLQTRLKALVNGPGVKLRSMQNLAPRADGSIRYMGARLDIEGTMQSVQGVIHSVETSKPYLFVATAVLKPTQVAAMATTGVEPTVSAQLEIFGITKVGEATR
jgi:general secretion pathway protein M